VISVGQPGCNDFAGDHHLTGRGDRGLPCYDQLWGWRPSEQLLERAGERSSREPRPLPGRSDFAASEARQVGPITSSRAQIDDSGSLFVRHYLACLPARLGDAVLVGIRLARAVVKVHHLGLEEAKLLAQSPDF
jgi:hypothetical protein